MLPRVGLMSFCLLAAAVPTESADDPEDGLVGGEALQHVLAGGSGADSLDDPLRDLEVDVRLEEGEADLPERGVDLGLGEDTLAAQGPEDPLQPLAQRFEQARSPPGGRTPTQSKS